MIGRRSFRFGAFRPVLRGIYVSFGEGNVFTTMGSSLFSHTFQVWFSTNLWHLGGS